MICLDMATFPLYACFSCGKVIGCYVCCVRLERCPNCRADIPDDAQALRGLDQGMVGSPYRRSSDEEIARALTLRRPTLPEEDDTDFDDF